MPIDFTEDSGTSFMPDDLQMASQGDQIADIPGRAIEVSLNTITPGLGTAVNSPYGKQFARGIALLQPPQGASLLEHMANSSGQNLPPALGGMLGASAGAPAGPGGAIGGAMLGGAAARGVQNMASMAMGNIRPTIQAISDIGKTGAIQGLAEGGGQVINAALKSLVRPGAQALRAGGGVLEKYGEAVLSGRVNLGNAPSFQEVSQAYKAFEESAGLTSPRLQRALNGEIVQSDSAALDAVQDVAKKLSPFVDKTATSNSGRVVYDMDAIKAANDAGKLPDGLMQDLYNSSQGAQHLLNMAKAGSPKEVANTANISAAKDAFDQALETIAPGYAAARQAAFQNAAKDAFSSFFPLNQNQSVNQLRGYSNLATAAAAPVMAAATGQPLLLAGMGLPFITSPLMYGMAIRGAKSLAPVSSLAGRAAVQGALTNYKTPASIEKNIRDINHP